jgi:hypothetical protein
MNLSELHSSPSIRISRPQLDLLIADLQPLVQRMLATMCFQRFFDALPSDCDRRLFVSCHKRLKKLCLELESLKSARQQTHYSLSLDVYLVGICITAVRAAMRTRGRSTPASNIPNTGAARQRRTELLRRLENYERQLRRRFQNEVDNPEGCARLIHQFALYRKALVRELFRPLRVVPNGLQILERALFESLVRIAENGLKESGNNIPRRELRRLVSHWLRKVRLSRAAVAIPDLLENPVVGEPYLVEFVRRSWARMMPNQKRDLSIVQSELAERLYAGMPEID